MKFKGDQTDVTALVKYAQDLEVENDRLRAVLRDAVPYIEGAQNTTNVDSYRAAGSLLEKIRALIVVEQKTSDK